MKNRIQFLLSLIFLYIHSACTRDVGTELVQVHIPFLWENATIYFLLTDRFSNGDTSNDFSYGRKRDGARLRDFMGGDLKGITLKIREGYFDRLGVNAIWMTPVFEQVHGAFDEGYGKNYAFHGYWIKDWTSLDANFGTYTDLEALVKLAHEHKIRVILDVIINHTGPVTEQDEGWPSEWVRTTPMCTYQDYQSNVACTIALNPDIRTESDKPVELPAFLTDKWKKEGRYEKEMTELDEFFTRTGYPRAPRYYIIKWLSDYVRKLGVDGFRVDTAKHTEASVWDELSSEAAIAFSEWKKDHPAEVFDDREFFIVGEAYGYHINDGRKFNYGDTTINFFNHGFTSLINFQFKSDANNPYQNLFQNYSDILNGPLSEKSVLNYISSHDDAEPFDKNRERLLESAMKLLLSPGAAQIYYGDELARPLIIDGTTGDATLRSMMNWGDLERDVPKGRFTTRKILDHWCRLGKFRHDHPAVGAGVHEKLGDDPYIFKRTLNKQGIIDQVVVVMGSHTGRVSVEGIFPERSEVMDYYSGELSRVRKGEVRFNTSDQMLLLGLPAR
ncbi:MAG TPA: alpha-amylase family glycosyl hydrolase [Cyclobacteriaceae bacterium]|nr:alpha-amylase family glycosyl hydrolase [Cyclobacteriaceae bacterium]